MPDIPHRVIGTTERVGGARRERTVSNDVVSMECGQMAVATTKSILKSPSETTGGTDHQSSGPAPISASYSRLLSSSSGGRRVAGPTCRFRQLSMDGCGQHHLTTGRAVKFFLESEGSEPPTPDKREKSPNNSTVGELNATDPNAHSLESVEHSPLKTEKQQKNNNSSPPFRRTSLPVQSITARHNLYYQNQVNSARGLLMDLLAMNGGELGPNVTACIRAVTALLNTGGHGGGSGGGSAGQLLAQQNGGNGGGQSPVANPQQLSLSEEFGLPRVLETPYSGEIHVSTVGECDDDD